MAQPVYTAQTDFEALVATCPTIPQLAQLRLAQLPECVLPLSGSPYITSATWFALFNYTTKMVEEGYPPGSPKKYLTGRALEKLVVLRRSLTTSQRRAVLLFPWEEYGLDGEGEIFYEFLLFHTLSKPELRLLPARYFSYAVQEVLVEEYAGNDEFQYELFANCYCDLQLRIASRLPPELLGNEVLLETLGQAFLNLRVKYVEKCSDARGLFNARPDLARAVLHDPSVSELSALHTIAEQSLDPKIKNHAAYVQRLLHQITLPGVAAVEMPPRAAHLASQLGSNVELWITFIDSVEHRGVYCNLDETLATARTLLSSKHTDAHY
jgi:hypothetical protein